MDRETRLPSPAKWKHKRELGLYFLCDENLALSPVQESTITSAIIG
ncbi:uncharacterized protein G2W53_022111 [Senna tora]|uniref:Uncharacterized protein n=1 Tax=Senna tora TaxID=362788 RepID=A0A834TM47_9FABA|nr:uncharacterized protein G2W53_022111 [Senna tora]